MISVLCVSHSSERNGAELWLLETLRHLDRKAFAPALVVPRPGPMVSEAEAAGVPVEVVPMKWWVTEKSKVWRQPAAWAMNRKAVNRIAAIARTRGAHVVLSNSAATFGGALAAKKAGLPHVWSLHEVLGGERAFLHYLYGARALTRFILDHSARVIVNSEGTRSVFPASEKIALIYNGLSMRSGDPALRAAARSEFGLVEGEPAVGVIGKLYPGKGQREVLQAVARLASRYPRLKLLILGEAAVAGYERELRAIVRREKLNGRVFFTGFRPDLSEILQTLSAVVVASVVDSFGRAALEAMAAGVPVLAVRAGGLTEIVQPGWNGFLAESRDPAVLAEALADLLDHPEHRPAIIENGFRTIREKFSIERQVKDVERVLREAAGGTLLVPPPFGAGRDGAYFAADRGREVGESEGRERKG